MRKMISTTVHTLTETEVNPVMNKLLQSGIEITALHNHLMRAMPVTFYMHVRGHGDPSQAFAGASSAQPRAPRCTSGPRRTRSTGSSPSSNPPRRGIV